MEIKYNIYKSINSNGPWSLVNDEPLDHDPSGNEYTIEGLVKGKQYYFMVIGGYVEENEFIPLISQKVGSAPQGALGVGAAPVRSIAAKEYLIKKNQQGTAIGHQFDITIA